MRDAAAWAPVGQGNRHWRHTARCPARQHAPAHARGVNSSFKMRDAWAPAGPGVSAVPCARDTFAARARPRKWTKRWARVRAQASGRVRARAGVGGRARGWGVGAAPSGRSATAAECMHACAAGRHHAPRAACPPPALAPALGPQTLGCLWCSGAWRTLRGEAGWRGSGPACTQGRAACGAGRTAP